MENNNGFLDEGDKGIVHWVSEILWREFYKHIIYNFLKFRWENHSYQILPILNGILMKVH